MKYFHKLNRILNSIWAIPTVLAIRLIRPILIIKIISLHFERIGHFVVDSTHHAIKNKSLSWNELNIFSIPKNTCNNQWAKMVKRNVASFYFFEHIEYWNKKIPLGEKHILGSNLFPYSRDVEGWFENNSFKFEFLDEENEQAKKWLESFGWKKSEPFVCLIVRDSAYLNSAPDFINLGHDWSYHDYRNSDISDYELSIKWLLEQGIWVIRMGKAANKPANIKHEKFIDYPFLDTKSDLLDVWLFANCQLCISTLCGIDEISVVYRRPILLVNFLPLSDIKSWSNAMYVPKKLIWKEDGRELSLRENLTNSFYYLEEYIKAKIEIEDLSEEEILLSVKESWEFIKNKQILNQESRDLQDRFWKIVNPDKTSEESKEVIHIKRNHEWIHPKTRAGENWLRSKEERFFL